MANHDTMSKKNPEESTKKPNTQMFVFMTVSKIIDSGLGVLMLMVCGLVGMSWVFARQLESRQAFDFLLYLVSLKGVGGVAIACSILMPFVFKRIMLSARNADAKEIQRLRKLNEEYAGRLLKSESRPQGATKKTGKDTK